MTVTYTSEVTNSRGFGCFMKLLFRWRGSIYKIVWAELVVFLVCYYFLKVIYEVVLYTESQKSQFRSVVLYCNRYASSLPLTFVLGFYVSLVTSRWWGQYTSIPFPDNLAILVGASISGQDEKPRIVRRTIVRYACLSFTITLTMMSPKVKRRFPTRDHLIEAGLLTEDEKKIMEDLDNEFPGYSKYWLPLAWASNIVTRSRHEGLIRDDESVKFLLEELNLFRSKCGGMLDYDWISLPLVYTQVVTIAVYSYFALSLLGNQYIENDFQIHAYFPLGSVLQFFFYMGWLKVAETLINPFGDDDDDFEVAWMIDRHLQVCYLLVDKIHQEHPRLMKDQYWAKKAPQQLPHTIASVRSMQEYPVPSTDSIIVKPTDQNLIIPHDAQVFHYTQTLFLGCYSLVIPIRSARHYAMVVCILNSESEAELAQKRSLCTAHFTALTTNHSSSVVVGTPVTFVKIEVRYHGFPEVLVNRLFGRNIRNRHRIEQFPLTMVSMGKQRTADRYDAEGNDYVLNEENSACGAITKNTILNGDDEEFQKLKQKRKEAHIERLIKNFALFREPESSKRIQMIKELVDEREMQ